MSGVAISWNGMKKKLGWLKKQVTEDFLAV
jgi:hypothetical protein